MPFGSCGPSYLRYSLKADADPHGLIERECRNLNLSPHFRSLLEQFVPATASRASAEQLSA
jgi:hypothetical protein